MWRVEEVYDAGKRTAQPGWDYVVDTGYDPSKAPIQPINKKRTAGGRTTENTTAKQNDATHKRIKQLEKDNHGDTHVPVPKSKSKDAASRSKGKTLATRKALSYQKTFAMWIEQEKSDAANAASNPVQQKPKPLVHPRKGTTANASSEIKEEPMEEPIPQVALRPASDGTEDSHLLLTNTPALPSEAEMERLCSAPPLSYDETRAGPSTSGIPPMHFCEVCGYWGKVKCITCGFRVCGLDCKIKHDIECQKYGGR